MEKLTNFITKQNQLSWQPGVVDCLMCLSDWIVELGWPDAASPYRGKYDNEADMYDFVLKGGGIENLIEGEVIKHGIQRCNQAIIGDIAVVGSTWNMRKQFGAIWDGQNWLVRANLGYFPVKVSPRAIWRTGGGRCLN